METKTKIYKRKQYLVSKRFQLKYVGLILLLMFMTAALCAYVVYYTGMLFMSEKLANVYPQGRFVHIVSIVNFRIFLSVILISPMVALVGIFLSHRISGPVYRLERVLEEIASGDLTPHITLRKKDELANLANGINSVTEGLRKTIGAAKSRLDKSEAEISGLKKALAAKSQDAAIADSLNRVGAALKEVNQELGRFKV